MKATIALLRPEHRVLSRELWQAFYNTQNPGGLADARRAFEAAPEEVRVVVLKAAVEKLQRKADREAEENPFD